ncbi:hypothetical protein [Myxosarcina sp. GI1]
MARFGDHIERLRSFEGREVYTFEYRMRHKSNEWLWRSMISFM